jgi:HSP20 family molecular chaperone IbpA
MIIVNLKPATLRSNSISQDQGAYYVSGFGNWHLMGRPTVWRPPTDVYETDDKIVIRVEIAGMHDGDVSVNFDHHILSISGNRSDPAEKKAYHQMEIRFGEFLSEVEILVPIEADKIKAEYQDGFLRVFLPKAAPKHVNITQE